MLGEGADQQDRRAGDHDSHHVKPERHAAHQRDPQQDGDAEQQVLGPDAPRVPQAGHDMLGLLAEEPRHAPERADQDPPQQGRLDLHEASADGPDAAPVLLGPVVGFRVVQRVRRVARRCGGAGGSACSAQKESRAKAGSCRAACSPGVSAVGWPCRISCCRDECRVMRSEPMTRTNGSGRVW